MLYNFTGGADGGTPSAGVVFDQAGNLYGTTRSGGAYGHGTVYKLTPSEGGWTESVLYSFTGGQDGDSPYGGVIVDQAGNLWGTTYQGGDPGCHCGTVFELSPSGGGWTFNLIHAFLGGSDGAYPAAGLASGPWGMLGTTSQGGSQSCGYVGCGTIYLVNGGYLSWNAFGPTRTGIQPQSTLFYDEPNGGFLGTTVWGPDGTGWGTVFAEYDQTIYTLYTFSLKGTAGFNPLAGVLRDSAGNIYGTTSDGWVNHGTVFEIILGSRATLKVLHQFLGADGSEPAGDLLLDAPGNIYGTTFAGGATGKGVLFKLTPGLLQKWTETVLHSFAGSDGASPLTSLVFDGADNLYGTTYSGGAYGAGVVFQMQNVRVGPKATLAPTSLSFGNQVINTTSTARTVTLSNTGDEILAISNITASGNFAVSTNTCGPTLALGAQCKVSLTFTPTVVGTLRGTLTFTDNAPNSPQTIGLNGVGVWPVTLLPNPGSFLTQAIDTTSAPKTFTLTNNQTVPLNGIAISTTGDFAVSATTCTTSLAAKSKCTISVTFTPTTLGKRIGALTVNDTASNSPQTAALSGYGVLPVSLTPSSAAFPLQTVGTTSSPKVFTLTNNLNETLDTIAISTTGDFAVSTTTCTTSLAARSKCTIAVAFTPTAIGTRKGGLSVSDAASNSPQTSTLTGSGK